MESDADSRPLLSIVIPCYNEAAVLATTWIRLRDVLNSLSIGSEVLFVNDGSTDGTGEILETLAAGDERVAVLTLSRNFGHQAALTAGLDAAWGDAVVLLDADLQDPPELIPRFLEAWREGGEVICGVRSRRHGEHPLRLWLTNTAYWLLAAGSREQLSQDSGDFCLLDGRVVEVLRTMRERDRYLRGLVRWLGFRVVEIPYERQPRVAGVSHYGWWKLLQLAADGWFSFCGNPLRCAFGVAGILTVLGGLLASGLIPVLPTEQRGLGAMICLIGGLTFLGMGWQGEYLSRIYLQDKGRPLYVVRQTSRGPCARACRPREESDAILARAR